MLKTWFIIIMAFKNVLFNRNTGLLQTLQKYQLASVEETSQEGCTPSVKVLISAKRDFLSNYILEDSKNPSLTHTFLESSLYTSRTMIQNYIFKSTQV